jgi:hypothetical protein
MAKPPNSADFAALVFGSMAFAVLAGGLVVHAQTGGLTPNRFLLQGMIGVSLVLLPVILRLRSAFDGGRVRPIVVRIRRNRRRKPPVA